MESIKLPIAPPGPAVADVDAGAAVASEEPTGLLRWVPALASLRGYGLPSFSADLVAGITVAAIALPQAMAYALVIGLPPQYGLYTAIVMTAVGALFDSSKQLINGPTNAISIAVLSALIVLPEADRLQGAILLALMVGLIQSGITLLRLGDLSRFISHAVVVGFTLGAAALLIVGQLPHLLGLARGGGGHVLAGFFHAITSGAPQSAWPLILGAGTIAVVLGLRAVNRWLARRTRARIPDMLVAVAGAAAAVWALDLEAQGVAVVGSIPASLPTFEAPTVAWEQVRGLAGDATAIALLGLLEAIAMAKAIAAQTRQKLDINQQCLSEGLANIAGSFFHCFPGSGSLTRSALNREAGAVSQWSGVVAAVAVAVTVLLFAPHASHIPRASLAAILVLTAIRMVDRAELRYHLRATRFDAGIVAATAISAVAISIEFCILIGVFLSFVLYVPRAARVRSTELVLTAEQTIRPRVDGDPLCTKMVLFNLEGELFFGAAPELARHFADIDARVQAGARVVILRLRDVRNPDAACLKLVDEFMANLAARGVHLILCGVRPDLADALARTGAAARLDRASIFYERETAWTGIQDAVARGHALLGDDLCETCPVRQKVPQPRSGWYYQI
ncbi:MAG: SulP family inorganic anion transporter [Nannocystaceae bacterium]